MMQRRVLFLMAVAVFCATAVDAKKKYDPFLIPRDQLIGQVKTVALREVTGISEKYERSDSVKTLFESLITAELEQAGFRVIPTKVYEQLRQEAVDSLGGGLFDPKTGAPDTVKAREVRVRTQRELKARHQADAVLLPVFVERLASFGSGTAHWDGASQKLWKGTQGLMGLFNTQSGTISALSLYVMIQDSEGNLLYMQNGGLSLVSRFSASGRFDPVPEDSLYLNDRRNAEAVGLALGPLTRPPKK